MVMSVMHCKILPDGGQRYGVQECPDAAHKAQLGVGDDATKDAMKNFCRYSK